MKKKSRRLKKALVILLTGIMTVNAVGVSAFAAESDSQVISAVSEEESTESPAENLEESSEENSSGNAEESSEESPSESLEESSVGNSFENLEESSEISIPENALDDQEAADPDIGISPASVTGNYADMRISVCPYSGFLMSAGHYSGAYAPIFHSSYWSESTLGGVLPRGHYVYCIEPAATLVGNSDYNEAGSLGSTTTLKNLTTSRVPNKGDIFTMLGRVLQVAGPDITDGADISGNPAQATKYLAAQTIIWEIVCGDMDKDFNSFSNNWKSTYDLSSMPYWNSAPSGGRSVKSWRDEWVVKLRNSKKRPSFTSSGSASAPTHEMNSDTLVLTDTNNVLQYMSLSASDSSVKLSVSGNKLTIKNPNQVDFTLTATNTICNGMKEPALIVTKNQVTGANRQKTITVSSTSLPDPIQGFAKIKASVKGNLELTKVSSEDENARLTGAVFGVYNSQGTKMGNMTDNGNGIYSYNDLIAGTYTVKEEKSPAGFDPDVNTYTVTISEQKTYTISNRSDGRFENAPIKGNIELTKVSVEDHANKLTGAVFGVFSGSTKLGEMTDKGNGTYQYSNLPIGTYTVKEEKAPTGFLLDQNSYTVTISESKTYTVATTGSVFTNTPIKGNIRIVKVDAENTANRLTDAAFSVFKTDGTKVGDLTNNGDGSYEYKNLYYGEYIIKETEAPTGFVLDEKEYPLSITEPKTYIIATKDSNFENAPIKGNVLVRKTSSNGAALSGAYFGVFKADGTIVGLMIDNGNGTYSYSNLRYGEYYIREMAAPGGYYTDSTKAEFAITTNGETVEVSPAGQTSFVNRPQVGDLHIVKKVEQSDLLHSSLSGYEFRIYSTNGYDAIHTTDVNGEIYISNLPVGMYTIHEIEKEGTNVDGSNFQFDIQADQTVEVRANQLVGVELVSRPSGYGCNMTYDVASGTLTGSTIAGQNTSGISLAQDIVAMPGETIVFSADVYVDTNCNWGLQRRNQVVDSTETGRFDNDSGAKSNTGRQLKAGEWNHIYFTYTNNNSLPLREASNIYLRNNGSVINFQMKNIKMTVARNGLDDTSSTVNPGNNNAVTNVTVNNNLRRGSLTVTKVDATNQNIKLANTTFLLEKKVYYLASETVPAGALSDENGSYHWVEVEEKTTDGEGLIVWGNLVVGDYRITEMKAAKGYQLLIEPVYISLPYVTEDAEIQWSYETKVAPIDQDLTIGNQPAYVIPNTGGIGRTIYVLIGMLMVAAGAAAVKSIQKKNLSKEDC